MLCLPFHLTHLRTQLRTHNTLPLVEILVSRIRHTLCTLPSLPSPFTLFSLSMDHTPTTKIRRCRCPTQCCSIRSLSPQHRTLVFIPIILLKVEATILSPEEEPDAGENECYTD